MHFWSVFNSFARYIYVRLSLPSLKKMDSDAFDENVPVHLCSATAQRHATDVAWYDTVQVKAQFGLRLVSFAFF